MDHDGERAGNAMTDQERMEKGDIESRADGVCGEADELTALREAVARQSARIDLLHAKVVSLYQLVDKLVERLIRPAD